MAAADTSADHFGGINMYDWLCLDLETTDARPEDVEREFYLDWRPSPTWKKPETVFERWQKALATAKEKAALVAQAAIISVGLRTNIDIRCLHAMEQHDPDTSTGALVEGFESTKQMLIALRTVLDTYCDGETMLVGHNIKSFDLPKLRFHYVLHSLKLPVCLLNRDQPLYDTMIQYRKYTSRNDSFMIGLNEVLEGFHLPSHKNIVDGAEIPRLHAAGEYKKIIEYQLLDVIAEGDLFLRMIGEHPELD
jgi:hypothetical protein